MGQLTPYQQEEFQTNPRFIGYKFPESIAKPETLEKRYIGKLSKKALNLMKGMLEMDPEERYTALECLADPYFDGLREPEVERLIKGVQVAHQNSQGQIRQESSKSRSSMRSNTIERESLSNATAKNKTSYGSKFLGVPSQTKASPAVGHTSKVQAVPITQVKALSLGGTKTGTVLIN